MKNIRKLGYPSKFQQVLKSQGFAGGGWLKYSCNYKVCETHIQSGNSTNVCVLCTLGVNFTYLSCKWIYEQESIVSF